MGSDNLKPFDGNRIRLEAIVTGFDEKQGFSGPQRIICLDNVRLIDDDQIAFKSLWLNCGKWSEMLQIGQNIAFDAKVVLKKKSKIERVTKVSIIEKDSSSSTEDKERELIEKAIRYGKDIWERTKGVDQVILELQRLHKLWSDGSWAYKYDYGLEALACVLVYSEWNGRSDDVISRLHEFVVWLKLMLDPSLENMDGIFVKNFYRYCIEQWFNFYQGE